MLLILCYSGLDFLAENLFAIGLIPYLCQEEKSING